MKDLFYRANQNIVIRGDSIYLKLPLVEVRTWLDNSRTRVIFEQKAFGADRGRLEQEPRIRAESCLNRAAQSQDLLDSAYRSACSFLYPWLRQAGYSQVFIDGEGVSTPFVIDSRGMNMPLLPSQIATEQLLLPRERRSTEP